MDGGGFLPFDGDQDRKPGASGGDADRKFEKKVPFPITSSMLHKLTLPACGLVVRQHKISQVNFVGRVTSVNEGVAVIEMVVKDPFGPPVIVQYWLSNENKKKDPTPNVSDWIRVFGVPKRNSNIKNGEVVIQSFKMMTVQNPNEIWGHYHASMVAHMQLAQQRLNFLRGRDRDYGFLGYKDSDELEQDAMKTSGNGFQKMDINKTASGTNGSASTPGRPGPVPRSSTDSDRKRKKEVAMYAQNRVKTYIIQKTKEDANIGANLNEISKDLNMPMKEVKDHIEKLQENGHIYTTIDEYTFKSTE
jgi:hypothetical protein